MIDALISGKLYGQPTERTSKSGKPFALAKVRAAGGDGESLFVNVIAFDAAPCTALLALGDGDSVALSGSLTPKVLTAYHVTRKRNASATQARQNATAPAHGRPRDEAWRAMAPRDRSGLDDGAPLDW